MDNQPIVVQPGHCLGPSLHKGAWGAEQSHPGTMRSLCPGFPPSLPELAGASVPTPKSTNFSVAARTLGLTGGVKRFELYSLCQQTYLSHWKCLSPKL